MYVAFRWLTALCCAMWVGLCGQDIYLAQYKTSIFLSTSVTPYEIHKFTNESVVTDKEMENGTRKNHRKKYTHHRVAYLNYVTFLGGAIVVFMYNKRTSLVTYCRSKLNISFKFPGQDNGFKVTAETASVAMLRYWSILKEKLQNYTSIDSQSDNGHSTNLSLLKRIRELMRDRKALCQILMTATEENKIIRRQCQSETIAKNRLLRYVQDTQHMMNVNKSRYVDFQQLYLTTSKENCYLKITARKLKHEKAEVEKNLLELINLVYRSRNNDLKTYCTRFLVKTKNNLLNSDVSAEIREFLQKSKSVATPFVNNELLASQITDIFDDDDNFASLGSRGPKLRGLPGEFVWTAKNKDGFIEKLYEFDCHTDFDHGDTIRRIREYSVYHDKDCFLDQTSLAANLPTCPSLSASATRLRLDIKSFSSQGFLTKMLVKNVALRLPSTIETPPLPYTTCNL